MQQESRQPRREIEQIYVRGWADFKKVWKDTKGIKQWGDPSNDECKTKIQKSLQQLIEDPQRQCYLFPASLKSQYIAIIIDLVDSQLYAKQLQYEYEGLYLDNPKQLIVFKRRASVSSYLSKYRLNQSYEKLFKAVHQLCKPYQKLIAQRNLLISKQQQEQQINKASQKIEDYEKRQLRPKLQQWKSQVRRIMEDFKGQKRKEEIMFIGVNSVLVKQIKHICTQFQLYYSNRYEKISDYDQYRDFCVTKSDKSWPVQQIDDISSKVSAEQQLFYQQSNQDWIKQIKIALPTQIQNAIFSGFDENGAKCHISIPCFQISKPIQYIKITLLYPQLTDKQKQYSKIITVQKQKYYYCTTLDCLNSGLSTYQFVTGNKVGESKVSYKLNLWLDGDINTINEKGTMKLINKDYFSYILGQNEEGAIPNFSKQDKDAIITTTLENWQIINLPCTDFSVSNQVAICCKNGEVAGWGKMYQYEEQKQVNQQNQEEDQGNQQDDLGLVKLDRFKFVICPPSLIIQNQYIRKISCGEGYCLMADYLGRVWAFGLNTFGQLGQQHCNQNIDTSEPALLPYFKAQNIFIVDVAATYNGSSFAIDSKGQGYRWGANQIQVTSLPIRDSYNNIINFQHSQVTSAQPTPIPIHKRLISQKIVSIKGGYGFSLALTQNNKLYGWGNTKYLGLGNVEDCHFNSVPNFCNPVPILDNVVEFSVGCQHVVALRMNDSLVGWGKIKCYKDTLQQNQIIKTPQIISKKYRGFFQCGPDFTVFENEENKLIVVGRNQIFKKKVYSLPCKPIKIAAGQGILMIMGQKSALQQQKKEYQSDKSSLQCDKLKQQKKTRQTITQNKKQEPQMIICTKQNTRQEPENKESIQQI